MEYGNSSIEALNLQSKASSKSMAKPARSITFGSKGKSEEQTVSTLNNTASQNSNSKTNESSWNNECIECIPINKDTISKAARMKMLKSFHHTIKITGCKQSKLKAQCLKEIINDEKFKDLVKFNQKSNFREKLLLNKSTSPKRRFKAVTSNYKIKGRNRVTVNMNYKTLKRPKSKILHIRNSTEENRNLDKIQPSVSTISHIKLNEHALKNLKKHWSKEIKKIKNDEKYRSRERSMTRLKYHHTPIININTGYGGMKPSRTRTKEKLKGKFSMKYKQSKEKEKFDQARFKTMDKKEKIKHIRGLVQVSNESSELQSSNSRNIDHPSNFQSKFMNSDLDLGQSMLDVGTDVRTFKVRKLNLSKLHKTIE
ncbi:unnamed protein product [Moneuplotes crassus]|uniref:Uncharacterized protein n=1 Tax=Euplotes crassus TaxID=5936 RepID=A0AAD1UL76_EUPCR|nr:unnamed protein product [Moneuplotes crassus]